MERVEVLLRHIDRQDDTFECRHQQNLKRNFDTNDAVRLWEEVAQQYARGLCWILQYYYQGIPSWDWYHPYHYPPFTSDFAKLKQVPSNFDRQTKPFSPLEQMMATFAPQNVKHLPLQWRPLMLEEASPVIEFYTKKNYD